MAKPKVYPFNAAEWIEWEYPRDDGDLLVFAPTRDDAIRELGNHGYKGLDPAKLVKRDRMLADVLKKEGIS